MENSSVGQGASFENAFDTWVDWILIFHGAFEKKDGVTILNQDP